MNGTPSNQNIPFKKAGANCGGRKAQSLPPGLAHEERSALTVLPVVAAQLQDVAKDVEQSVAKVCNCFQDMILRARQATAQVNRIDDSADEIYSNGKIGLNHLIAEMRETLADLLQRIEHTSTFSSQMVDRLNSMESQIEGLDETLCDIDEVARKSRLLALNGQLEAARAGEQGAAFSIVATETAKMAVHAVDSSKKIRKMIGSISQSIQGASGELKAQATSDTREAALSREEVNRSLDDMSALHEDMQNTILQSNRNSEELTRDISQAVMALQFQDAVNQRIDHAVRILLDLHDSLGSYPTGDGAEDGCSQKSSTELPADEWSDRMAKSYTMAAEHQVLASQRYGKTDSTANLGNNVELF